ncbi:MAG TPA: hypothetical protein VJY34_01640 [Roseiarcus sp.]|nr:hypothetical protein [Roseiarcus sp.]
MRFRSPRSRTTVVDTNRKHEQESGAGIVGEKARRLQIERHDRDNDGDGAVGQGLEAAFEK